MRPRGRRADDSPHNHHRRQVKTRFSNLVQKQITRDLHQQISDEQDTQRGQILRGRQAEPALGGRVLQSCESCGSNIVAVEVVHDVHQHKHGEKAQVDFAGEGTFREGALIRREVADQLRGFAPDFRVGGELGGRILNVSVIGRGHLFVGGVSDFGSRHGKRISR